MIRQAEDGHLAGLQDIERAAGDSFRAVGMQRVADDDPPTIDDLRAYLDEGRLWVWVAAPNARPAGYLLADVVDGNAHIEQVSVHPDFGHRGIGRALIEHCVQWARQQGYPAVTLTTFTEVPWNGPYYRRLGFRELSAGEFTPGLQGLRAHEAANGLDQWPRECLRLDLPE